MSIHVGTAPDSWGVWFPNNNRQISWARFLDEAQKAGYEGIELGPWGYLPNEYAILAEELDKRRLKLVGATAGGNFVDDGSIDEMCAAIDVMVPLVKKFSTAKYVVLLVAMYTDLMTGKLVMPKRLTDAERSRLYKNVQRVCDHVRSSGLVPALHPHVDCYIETEEEIEGVLENTDATLCLDTGHHVYGGGEPIGFYKKHHNRIPYLHIKECDMMVKKEMDINGWSFAKAVTKNIMCEPGNGSIDFSDLFSFMTEIGYDGWVVVEQDLYPVDNFEVPYPIAKRTREYLRSLGL